ncbi:mitotic checkpoint protein BUB3.3 isoform X1 [Camellia sinensis]|uniref:mitotic checkpoint protein BUB3.3 isoform X1 n=1 Tax=Camellia sinensis TaxID=4442 RepID=UPI0010358AE6|nr:mitotic checkpoint protein BUB3.3 isoform X1 [Camellia sinensis]XP_028078890.1 mitotic checkpoint protein BUB3.3 isoform X1 [Camellia sinensis]
MNEGTRLKFQNPIGDAITRIRFAPKSNNLLISSWDTSVRLYDLDSFMLRVEAPSEAALLDCCFQNESVAFGAGSDSFIRRYDLDSGIHDTLGNHDDLVSCVEYSAETRQLITGGWDKKIMSWDTRSTNTLGCLNTAGADVESMAVSGFHLMVAVGSSVNIYDLRNFNKSVYVKELCLGIQIRCVRPILNCEGFVAGSIDGRIALEYLNSSDTGYVFWCHPKSKDGRHQVVAVNDIAFNPFVSGAFVTGNNEGYVTSWDAQSKKRLLQFPRYSNSVSSLSYNHGGQLLAVASSHTYTEANEIEEPPQIFIHEIDDICTGSVSAGNSTLNKIAQDII